LLVADIKILYLQSKYLSPSCVKAHNIFHVDAGRIVSAVLLLDDTKQILKSAGEITSFKFITDACIHVRTSEDIYDIAFAMTALKQNTSKLG
jgi:hypothetical protein